MWQAGKELPQEPRYRGLLRGLSQVFRNGTTHFHSHCRSAQKVKRPAPICEVIITLSIILMKRCSERKTDQAYLEVLPEIPNILVNRLLKHIKRKTSHKQIGITAKRQAWFITHLCWGAQSGEDTLTSKKQRRHLLNLPYFL